MRRLRDLLAASLLLCAFAAPACSSETADQGEDESSAESAIGGTVSIGARYVTTANLNLRGGPGTTFPIVRVLPKGTIVVIVDQTTPVGAFYRVKADADVGWVHGKVLAPADPATNPPDPPRLDPNPTSGNGPGRGFPVAGPWASFYGPASGMNLAKVASTFRIINLDADPAAGNFTRAQIETLKAGGQNRVISYLNLGSCEKFRTYWGNCVATGALTTSYDGYPDEKWANLSNVAYQDLMVNHVAAKLASQGVDGFFLDNLEVVEHGAGAESGPCNAACAQGGLDLVWRLRQAYPDMLIVMQNATGTVTRNGTTHGVPFRSLLDGISHEEVYSNGGDDDARAQMLAWKQLGLTVAGRPFWLAVEDYVGACAASKKSLATSHGNAAASDGFSSYVTDESGAQQKPCFWSDF